RSLAERRLRTVQRLLDAERFRPLERRFLQLQRGLRGGDRVEAEARDEQRVLAGEAAGVADRRGFGERVAEQARRGGEVEAEHPTENDQRGDVGDAVRLRPLGSAGAQDEIGAGGRRVSADGEGGRSGSARLLQDGGGEAASR